MLFSKSRNQKMEEIREFLPVSSSSDFDSVAPHILNAGRPLNVILKNLFQLNIIQKIFTSLN